MLQVWSVFQGGTTGDDEGFEREPKEPLDAGLDLCSYMYKRSQTGTRNMSAFFFLVCKTLLDTKSVDVTSELLAEKK